MKSDILNNKTNSITRLFFKINWSIYFFLTLLCILGGVILYSVSGGNFHPLVSSHLIKYLISSLALFFCCFISINVLYKSSYVIYAFSIILLIAVLILGNNDFGANRWLYLAGFTFQPSEFSKSTSGNKKLLTKNTPQKSLLLESEHKTEESVKSFRSIEELENLVIVNQFYLVHHHAQAIKCLYL